MIVCICNQLSNKDVEQAIAHGAETPSDVFAYCGVRVCCGSCCGHMEEMIETQQQHVQPVMFAMAQSA